MDFSVIVISISTCSISVVLLVLDDIKQKSPN